MDGKRHAKRIEGKTKAAEARTKDDEIQNVLRGIFFSFSWGRKLELENRRTALRLGRDEGEPPSDSIGFILNPAVEPQRHGDTEAGTQRELHILRKGKAFTQRVSRLDHQKPPFALSFSLCVSVPLWFQMRFSGLFVGLKATLSLTPALSSEERENRRARFGSFQALAFVAAFSPFHRKQRRADSVLDEVTKILQLDGEIHVVHHHLFGNMQNDGSEV